MPQIPQTTVKSSDPIFPAGSKVTIPGQLDKPGNFREVPQKITEPTPAAVPPQREANKSWRSNEKN